MVSFGAKDEIRHSTLRSGHKLVRSHSYGPSNIYKKNDGEYWCKKLHDDHEGSAKAIKCCAWHYSLSQQTTLVGEWQGIYRVKNVTLGLSNIRHSDRAVDFDTYTILPNSSTTNCDKTDVRDE